jgi:hypothetical protein
VWTLQRANKPPPRLQTSFVYAKPSLTHMVRGRAGCSGAAAGGRGDSTAAGRLAGHGAWPSRLSALSPIPHPVPAAPLQALLALLQAGKLTYVCSQNVE